MDIGDNLIPIIAIMMGTGMPVVLAGLILWYQSRKTQQIHETAIRLAEKGQPVPPEFFLGKQAPESDLRRGLVLVGLGIGLLICLAQIEVSWGFGLIPLFTGIGYLMVWQLETKNQGRS